jgi:RNA polymerase sigma-70 factor, ECF subfamily
MILQQISTRSREITKELFCTLLEEKKTVLYRIAFMYVKNEHDAMEILNEAVYKAFISMKKLKDIQFFHTWITRILINCALDHIKRSKRLVSIEDNFPQDYVEDDKREDLLDLYEAVDKLQGKYKTVIILKYFEDLTISQIAGILECPANTVKTYLHKALKELRCELKEENF